MSADEAQGYHAAQIEAFRDGEADMISAITMTDPEEAVGIARAAKAAGLPAAISFTVETDGRLPSGDTLQAVIEQVDRATASAPAYYMINCAHPLHFEDALAAGEASGDPWVHRIRGIRANASTMSHAKLDAMTKLDFRRSGRPWAPVPRVETPPSRRLRDRRLLRHRPPPYRRDLRGLRRAGPSPRRLTAGPTSTPSQEGPFPMFRFVFLVFGSGAYAVSFATILYAIGFVANLWVPKGIDSGAPSPLAEALVVDTLLLTVFALQHSIMARPRFKRLWTLVVPKPIERSTYVLFASLSLILLFWQWRPMPMPLWTVTDPTGAAVLQAASVAGWALVLVSTFLISHFELFGVKQVVMHWLGRAVPETAFRTPLLYNLVRHPIYLGFIIAFWATPTMTAGHLLFAALTTAYIVIGIQLEERDLVRFFGKTYLDYRERVAMLVPGLRWKRSPEAGLDAGHTRAASLIAAHDLSPHAGRDRLRLTRDA